MTDVRASTRATAASERLFAAAQRVLPGGVNSPVRAFRSVGGTPRFIARGEGAWLEDADGNRYVDLVLSWGPLILGHAHPEVVAAVVEAAGRGTTYGAPTELEVRLAERVVAAVPLARDGAVREQRHRGRHERGAARARGHRTPRHRQVRRLLSRPRRRAAGRRRLGRRHAGPPRFAGGHARDGGRHPDRAVQRSRRGVEALFAARGADIAAVLVEPVAGNMGVVPPAPGFLEGLRTLTRQAGALLVFDEVMTGWRVHPVGAQVLYGVSPDLTILGKVVGGGLPAAAYGGSRALMEQIAPAGPVYQAGTLSGNPLAMAAGLATLDVLARPGTWERAERWAGRAADAIVRTAGEAGVAVTVQRVGTMLTPFFTDAPVRDYAAAKRCDRAAYGAFFHAMLEGGVYLAPSAFEAAFTSAVHGDTELAAFEAALGSAWAR